MNINEKKDGTRLIIELEGRLDTITAPQLEDRIKKDIAGVDEFVLDLALLSYISSAGLRVLLAAQKIMNGQGQMKVRNVNDTVMEVLEITGFSDILTIE